MDHLDRCGTDDVKWEYSSEIGIIDMNIASIIECKIEGEWTVSDNRDMTFLLQNHELISSLVNEATRSNTN